MMKTRDTGCLDSCASHHLTNDRNLFVGEIKAKRWDFTTAGGQLIRSEGVGTVKILLVDGSSIKLEGVADVPDFKSKLISLGQLRERKSRITTIIPP